MQDLQNLRERIREAKTHMEELWRIKQITDQTFLEASERVDSLINTYNKLLRSMSEE